MNMTCGEATMRLLARYGVTTVFGIPGVHTLDICRGLTAAPRPGAVRHVQARNEQGAGFMAEGWARATGKPGVAVVISGPGVTNASTALGQCYADSLPMLLISAEPHSNTIGKGRGVLHEITEQRKVTEPMTAMSVTVRRSEDVPVLLAQAFSIFARQRPRPVHISLPVDVQAENIETEWEPVSPPARQRSGSGQVREGTELLRGARRPLIMIGGGAVAAGRDLMALAETLGAVVMSSCAGKGIIADRHPLHLTGSTVRAEARAYISRADIILAVGTELSETDSFVDRLPLNGKIVRVDLDPHKIDDQYPADIGIIGDAASVVRAMLDLLHGHIGVSRCKEAESDVARLRSDIYANLSAAEQQHRRLLNTLRRIAPDNTVFSGDACQLVYTGAFAFDVPGPRQWFYPAGFCALGNALPNAIGAKQARPNVPVVVLAGDGGFMFTCYELVTAAELGLPLPIIIWENGGLKQIQDDMDARGIDRVGVDGMNPDFVALAKACHCNGIRADSEEKFTSAFAAALRESRPTVITVKENDPWLV